MSTYKFALEKLAQVDQAAVIAYPGNTQEHWTARFAYRERELRRLLQFKWAPDARNWLERMLEVLS